MNSSGYGKEKDDNRIDRKQPPNLSTVYDFTRMINKSFKKFHQIITPIKYRVSPGIERKIEPTEQPKYKPEEVLGNLNDLYRTSTGIKDTTQTANKSFFQNQYKEFEKSLEN